MNSFLASGGDNFATLAQGTNRADSGKVDLQSMVDYFVANPVASPDYAQRSVGVTVTPAAEGGYTAGDEISLGLSSLLFSNGGPTSGTVEVRAGDTLLGSSAIDGAIVDTTDEVGRATVPITIPEGTPGGPLVLTITVPETGTSAEVTLEVTATENPIEVVAAPSITGNPAIGRTLRTDGGSWSVENPTLSYQWTRDGEAIEGATDARYTLVAADAGTEVGVTVTATAEGFTPATAESETVTVGTIATSISGSPDSFIVSRNATVDYSFRVRATGSGAADVVPVGDVAIYDGRKLIATVTLEVDDNGRATVTLPRLSRGIHLLTPKFLGSDTLDGSTGWPSLLLVY